MKDRAKNLVIWIGPIVCVFGIFAFGDGAGWWLSMVAWVSFWYGLFWSFDLIRNKSPHLISNFVCASLGPDWDVGEMPPITVEKGKPGAGKVLWAPMQAIELNGGLYGVPLPGGRDAGYMFVKRGCFDVLDPTGNIWVNGFVYMYLPAERLAAKMAADMPGIIRKREDLPKEFVEFLRLRRSKRFTPMSPIYIVYSPKHAYLTKDDVKGEFIALPHRDPVPLSRLLPGKSLILDANSRVDRDQSQQIANLTDNAGSRERVLKERIGQLEAELLNRSGMAQRTSPFANFRNAIEEQLGSDEGQETPGGR
jgi:hypothetical protein